jgi:hypothetical protein
MAGANSIFSSDEGRMLTKAAPSPDYDADRALLEALGLKMRAPFQASAAEAERREGRVDLSLEATAVELDKTAVTDRFGP